MGSYTTESNAGTVAAPTSFAAPEGGDHDLAAAPAIAAFDDMPLHQALLRGVYSTGFEKPSPIQQRAIGPIAKGGDVVAQAPSGTGKTGAFAIGLLARIDPRQRRAPQAVVLAPTRELALQTAGVVAQLGEFLFDGADFCHTFVGGTRVADDCRKLTAGTAVAVGTPGRVLQLVEQGALRTERLRVLVLDEADEMLSQGFAEQMAAVFRFVPKDVQVVLVSATLPPEVLALAGRFMRAPTRILCPPERLTLEGIRQFYVAVAEADKLCVLVDLYESVSIAQSVIFANSRRKVEWLAAELNALNHTVSFLHGDMPKGDRQRVLDTFRSGASRVLIASDVMARGIDVHQVNLVINYDLPQSREGYLHRIGRGGRYGKKGIAINFAVPGSAADAEVLGALERHYATHIDELPENFASYLGEDA